MAETLYSLPVPSTAFLGGVKFQVLSKRCCTLTYEYEGKDETVTQKMIFSGVESLKCTYHQSVGLDVIKAAYDKVVDFGMSDWLSEIVGELSSFTQNVDHFRHLGIYFDDGPSYEFICTQFSVESSSTG